MCHLVDVVVMASNHVQATVRSKPAVGQWADQHMEHVTRCAPGVRQQHCRLPSMAHCADRWGKRANGIVHVIGPDACLLILCMSTNPTSVAPMPATPGRGVVGFCEGQLLSGAGPAAEAAPLGAGPAAVGSEALKLSPRSPTTDTVMTHWAAVNGSGSIIISRPCLIRCRFV